MSLIDRVSVAPVRSRAGAPVAVAAVTVAVGAAIWATDPTTPGGLCPQCPTKTYLGVICPGCGSLRMLYSLMHGDITTAFRFNALGVVAVALLVWAYVAWSHGRLSGRRIRSWQNLRWSPMIALVAVSMWFVVRNIPAQPFLALRV